MKQSQGMVLYIVVILLLLLTIIAIAAMNVGVVDERISRNRYGSEESLLAAESGALKVVACFSGATNDLCQSTFALGTQERLNFLDGQTHDFFMANGKSTRFIAYPPKPAIVLPNPAQFVLPATAVGLPVAAWPRELETPDAPETLCPLHASCVTAAVYPKVESNEANEGIGSDLGYAIVAGGTVTIEAGTTQTGGNEDNGSSESGSGSSDQNTAPPSSALQQHLWLAELSNPGHRFDFPWLAQNEPPPQEPTQPSNNEQQDASQGQGGGNGQNQQRTIAASIHAQNGIVLTDVNVTGFATSGGQVTPASQVTVQVWDQGNCKDCFLDVENDFQNFTDRIKSYAETIKKTYPDRFQDNQDTFGSAQSNSGNEDNGSSESGSGSSDQNTAPAPTSPSSGLQQHVWLAALSNPGHRFDFPWLVAQGQPPEEQPTESPQPSDEENNENSNTQTPEPMDLQGNVYYYDGDVTIYSNAAPVNGTIVATGDIIVEPFATGSGAALCPGDEPLVGQTVVVAQTLLQFGQLAIPWATSAAALAATVSTAAAGTAATAGAGAVAAAPASAAQILEFALQTLDLAQSGTVALNQLCGLARSAVSTATGLLPGSSAESAEETDSQEEANSQNDSQGSTGSDPSADSTTDSPEQSASQNDTQESGAGGLLPNNNPQESFALNLIAGGNIELHRDLLGTMIAKGDITIGPEVMQIAYPSLPEEAPRIASWQRNYRLDKN